MAKKKTVDRETGEIRTLTPSEMAAQKLSEGEPVSVRDIAAAARYAPEVNRLNEVRAKEVLVAEIETLITNLREGARELKKTLDRERQKLRQLILSKPEEELDFDAEE